MKKLLVLLSLAFFLQGCAYFSTTKPDAEKTDYQLLLRHNAEWQDAIKTISGDMRITLDTPEYSGNLSAEILRNESDSLLITVTGPFGMRLGKVYFSKSRFVFYNQAMNQFYTGDRAQLSGRRFLQFPMDVDQLSDLFTAQNSFNVLQKQSYSVRDDQYYLEASNGAYSYHIWFDPENYLITRIEYYLEEQLQFYKEYDNFRKVNGIYFPHLVNFVRPDEKQGVTIIYTGLQINEPIAAERYNIHISDSATQIDLSL